jgi:hypothetical protein
MLSRRGICRPSPFEKSELDRLRKVVEEAANILRRCPSPETFLGRKTQEPFAKEVVPKKQTGGATEATDDWLTHAWLEESRRRPKKRVADV